MSTEQVIDAIKDRERLAQQGGIAVKQLMTAAPVCVLPEATAPEVAKLIYTKPFHHLLVVDANGSLVGVLSDRDVIRCFCRNGTGDGTGIAGLTAADIMSADPETIVPDTPLKEAVGLMRDRRISSLPVMKGAKPVGILTDSDLWTLLHTLLDVMETRHGKT